MRLIAVIMLLATCAIAAPPQAFLNMWRAAQDDTYNVPPTPILMYLFRSGDATDSIAGRNGTATPGVAFADSYAIFNGNTNTYILNTNAAVIPPSSVAATLWTVSMWANRTTNSATGTLIAYSSSGSDNRYRVFSVTNRVQMGLVNATGADRSFTVTNLAWNGNWAHYGFTMTNGIMSGYIDGSYVGRTTNSGTINANRWTLGIVFQQAAQLIPFDGLIDSVVVYDRALSDDEMMQLYTIGRD